MSSRVFILTATFTSITAIFIWNDDCPGRIKYRLYSYEPSKIPNEYKMFYELINLETIKRLDIKKNTPIKVFLHGYLGSPDNPMIINLITAYLKSGAHVIAADYHHYYLYTSLFAAKSILGRCTAVLIRTIVQKNHQIRIEQFHVIGFSIGGQIAAQVSNHLGKTYRLERITGLDPTSLFFFKFFVNDEDKLNKNHAKFVDVIHTDVFCKGSSYNGGHYDFYVEGLMNHPKYQDYNDHLMAVICFTETIEKNLKYSVREMNCSVWKWFIGRCLGGKNMSIEFGEHATKPAEAKEGSYMVSIIEN